LLLVLDNPQEIEFVLKGRKIKVVKAKQNKKVRGIE
jgi:hypothetical protein